jgi:enterochelin esterase-like enzyme
MYTRQAVISLIKLSFLALLTACSSANAPTATQTLVPPTLTPEPSSTPTQAPPTLTPTPTPLACLSKNGKVKEDVVETTSPPQQFLIYLPPCYGELNDTRYPVLYLLHGQTYIDDQWPRLGAVDIANRLIISGEAPPFIMVFPDDRYWNLPSGPGFGGRFVDYLVPYVDENYRTIADREHRALGGLSRGGGWTIRLGFEYWELFGTLGLHSPVVFVDDGPILDRLIDGVPVESWPRLWIDIGDRDAELTYTRRLESFLNARSLPHVFHFYSGDHTETYWGAHTEEYLRWYAEGWQTKVP